MLGECLCPAITCRLGHPECANLVRTGPNQAMLANWGYYRGESAFDPCTNTGSFQSWFVVSLFYFRSGRDLYPPDDNKLVNPDRSINVI